jgi:hypothetical protein
MEHIEYGVMDSERFVVDYGDREDGARVYAKAFGFTAVKRTVRVSEWVDVDAPDPRRIETEEQLDALPEGTVVLDCEGLAWQYNHGWTPAIWRGDYGNDNLDLGDLPATVVYLPEES